MKTVRALILTVAVAVAATLTACNRDRETVPEADAPSTPAAAATTATAPLEFESYTPFAKVRLTLPDEIKAQPELHAALYAKEVQTLRQFVEGAQGEQAGRGSMSSVRPMRRSLPSIQQPRRAVCSASSGWTSTIPAGRTPIRSRPASCGTRWPSDRCRAQPCSVREPT